MLSMMRKLPFLRSCVRRPADLAPFAAFVSLHVQESRQDFKPIPDTASGLQTAACDRHAILRNREPTIAEPSRGSGGRLRIQQYGWVARSTNGGLFKQ